MLALSSVGPPALHSHAKYTPFEAGASGLCTGAPTATVRMKCSAPVTHMLSVLTHAATRGVDFACMHLACSRARAATYAASFQPGVEHARLTSSRLYAGRLPPGVPDQRLYAAKHTAGDESTSSTQQSCESCSQQQAGTTGVAAALKPLASVRCLSAELSPAIATRLAVRDQPHTIAHARRSERRRLGAHLGRTMNPMTVRGCSARGGY